MDAAIQAFLVTIAIVGGILSPLILIAFISTLGKTMEAVAAQLNKFTAELKRKPPFEDVEVNVNPATNVMTVRMLKNGEIIWQGASSRRDMEVDNILTFKQTEVTD
jgi:hypothetical protein